MTRQLIERAPVLILLAAIEDLHRISTLKRNSGYMVHQQAIASSWANLDRIVNVVKQAEILVAPPALRHFDDIDPQEEYETLRDAIDALAGSLGYELDGDAAESYLCTQFLKLVISDVIEAKGISYVVGDDGGKFVIRDFDRLVDMSAALGIALKDGYQDVAGEQWNSLPQHLQELIDTAEDRLEAELSEETKIERASTGEFNLVDDLAPSTRVLTAYQVGEYDIVAAYDTAGALAVLVNTNYDAADGLTEDDVEPVGIKVLDATEAFDQDEGKMVPIEKPLRQLLNELTEPGWLWGWE